MKQRSIPSPDVVLSTWPRRTIRHTIHPNGSQLATPTEGTQELSDSEWEEYSQIVSSRDYRKMDEVSQ
jgi:hypothetical protein